MTSEEEGAPYSHNGYLPLPFRPRTQDGTRIDRQEFTEEGTVLAYTQNQNST